MLFLTFTGHPITAQVQREIRLFRTQLHGPRLFGRTLSPGHDVLAASILTDPYNQALGRCDFEGDPEQHREREKVQPAAMPGEQADARPDAEQPGCPHAEPPADEVA